MIPSKQAVYRCTARSMAVQRARAAASPLSSLPSPEYGTRPRPRDGFPWVPKRTLCHLPFSLDTLIRFNITQRSFSVSRVGADTVEEIMTLHELKERLQLDSEWVSYAEYGSSFDTEVYRETVDAYTKFLEEMAKIIEKGKQDLSEEQLELLSSEVVACALRTLSHRYHFDPPKLSKWVGRWEELLRVIKKTKMTDQLSLRLLTVHGKAGNVGRAFALLELRKSRGYYPRDAEFDGAATAVFQANLELRRARNIFISDQRQPRTDNPTRWLDAILLNMSERGHPLTIKMVNRMLGCYTAGWTGKAVHHFYRIVREPVLQGPPYNDKAPLNTKGMPHERFYHHQTGKKYQPIRVSVRYNNSLPPFHKVPIRARGKLVHHPISRRKSALRLDIEYEPKYSVPLADAFAFVESLQLGACGHPPIALNHDSYVQLIQACVKRGALWRAMELVDTIMPTADIEPEVICYNWILRGLARVGDVVTAQEYYSRMRQAGILPDKYTVDAIVRGLLNVGDLYGASTVVQDFFNRFSILPPFTVHLKIIEMSLGQDLIYDAKRHCYFIQSLWKCDPNEFDDPATVLLLKETQKNPFLQRPALEKLFAYFGEELTDADFA